MRTSERFEVAHESCARRQSDQEVITWCYMNQVNTTGGDQLGESQFVRIQSLKSIRDPQVNKLIISQFFCMLWFFHETC